MRARASPNLLLSTALMLAAGCASSEEACPARPEPACRYEVGGACVVFEPADPPLLAADVDVAARLREAFARAAACWEVDPAPALEGLTVVLTEHATWRDGELALGAASADCRMLYLSDGVSPIGLNMPGCFELMLPHEFGHLVLPGDREHADRRWACADATGEILCEELSRR